MKQFNPLYEKYTWAAPVIHCPELAPLVEKSYKDIDALIDAIARLGTCRNFHWSSGAVPAVRPDLGRELLMAFERGHSLHSALGLTSKELKHLMQLGHDRSSDSSSLFIAQTLVSKAIPELQPLLMNTLSRGQCVCCALGLNHLKPGLEAAEENGMLGSWDRDGNEVSLGEEVAVLDPELGKLIGVPEDAWKRVLFASLQHHFDYRYRFTDIIENRRTGLDIDARPHILWDGITLAELAKKWGYAQNDALGLMNFNMFYHLNSVRPNGQPWLVWDSSELQPMGHKVGGLLIPYWDTVNVHKDFDFSAWEDMLAKHSTSILAAAHSLLEQSIFVSKHGPIEVVEDGKRYEITLDKINRLLKLCIAEANAQLPNEFMLSSDGSTRDHDTSLLIPLAMGAISGRHIVSEEMRRQILYNWRQNLMGSIGGRRYRLDKWNGQSNNDNVKPGEEAEWTLGDPMVSFIHGEMYLQSGNQDDLDAQTFHLNRAIGCIDEKGTLPESWIIDPGTGQRIPNINNPLQWPGAMLLRALYAMKLSLKFRDSRKK